MMFKIKWVFRYSIGCAVVPVFLHSCSVIYLLGVAEGRRLQQDL